MLEAINELDEENRKLCLENGWIALDPRSGDYLVKGNEPSEAGEPTRYYHISAGVQVLYLEHSDEEAINQVNLMKGARYWWEWKEENTDPYKNWD